MEASRKVPRSPPGQLLGEEGGTARWFFPVQSRSITLRVWKIIVAASGSDMVTGFLEIHFVQAPPAINRCVWIALKPLGTRRQRLGLCTRQAYLLGSDPKGLPYLKERG